MRLHHGCETTHGGAETSPEVLATFETCLQQFTSYAVSEDVQQASAIPKAEQVSSESGAQFTTTPGLAENVRQAGTVVATGVHTVGEYVGRGIVQVGEWYRSRYPPCEESVAVSEVTKSRYVSVPVHTCPAQLRSSAASNRSLCGMGSLHPPKPQGKVWLDPFQPGLRLQRGS